MNTVSKRTNCAIKSNLTDEFVDNIESIAEDNSGNPHISSVESVNTT